MTSNSPGALPSSRRRRLRAMTASSLCAGMTMLTAASLTPHRITASTAGTTRPTDRERQNWGPPFMAELAVITPTYREDAEIFADLHRSVLEFTPDDTIHH